ncbi:alpha/beta hydrolase fold-domain-containing protein [Mucor mucedo]|uniref:alpha/beta hydrolase fold-domain-containing protein n=1 Tax=Mucor mucedo TaxID=29922 RepID=UPI00222087C1|nr:alpha/beta hydrolase fold-domain-containing protein [Mucor mucedo]KAI7892618.1 alpha/beta hydrolase fold-domain-containing protein [Mucor mucedo]
MNSVRASIRKLPPSASIKILKKVFSLPAPAARLILNDVTRARKSHRPWIHKVKLNPNQAQDWSGCWIGENIHDLNHEGLMKRVYEADIVLFYVHGGGFRIGSCTMYMDTNIAWIKVLKEKYGLKCMIMSVDYRLAPEHRYPSPVEDVVRAYEHLVQKLSVHSEKIIVIGDSAGAALALEMLFITHDPSMFEIEVDDNNSSSTQPVLTELPRPAGTVLISPLVTDETTSESWRVNQKYDYITNYTAKVIKRDYFEPTKEDEDDEDKVNQILGIAKLQTGFSAFMSPQVLMYIGNLEVLRDDALQLALKAEQDGVAWQTVIEDNVHDWFCVREVVKDKTTIARADQTFADFCYRAIGKPVAERQQYIPTPRNSLSNGLAAVKEEDESDVDDESSYLSDTTPSSSSLFDFRLSKLSLDEFEQQKASSKRSSDIVFV